MLNAKAEKDLNVPHLADSMEPNRIRGEVAQWYKTGTLDKKYIDKSIKELKSIRHDVALELKTIKKNPIAYKKSDSPIPRTADTWEKLLNEIDAKIKDLEAEKAKAKDIDKNFKKSLKTTGYHKKGAGEKTKIIPDPEEEKKSKLGFFKKKLTKESANDFKLEVYESWNNGILTDSEKNFMINYINESVEEE